MITVKKIQYNVTQCDYTIYIRGDLGVMNSSKCLEWWSKQIQIFLYVYTCTSYFPEYIVYNKCENVNNMRQATCLKRQV
jgi:hypothetical protein